MTATCAKSLSCAGTVAIKVTGVACGTRPCTRAVRNKALKIALPAQAAFSIDGRGARPVRLSVAPKMRRNIPAVGTVLKVRITVRQPGLRTVVLTSSVKVAR